MFPIIPEIIFIYGFLIHLEIKPFGNLFVPAR